MIHVEGLTEECLLFSLGLKRHDITRHSSKGEVCKVLEKGENLIGIVDEDPQNIHQDTYYKKMLQFKPIEKFGVIHCIDKLRNNTMIIIKPRFEDWIIDIVHQEGRRMTDFNLSDGPNELHKIVSFRKGDLERLLRFLRDNNCKALAFIEQIIS